MKTNEEIIAEINKLVLEHRQKFTELVKLEGKIEALNELLKQPVVEDENKEKDPG